MDKYSRLGKNTLLVFGGNAGAKLIGLLMLPLYTRWLSVDDYGITDILGVYVSLLLGIISCCIGEALFIFPKGVDEKKKTEYFSSGICFLVLSMLLTAAIFFIISFISKKNGWINTFTNHIWIIYGMIACSIAQQITQQFTRSLDKMVVYSVTGIVVTLCTAGFAFLFIPKYGVYGYVLSTILASLTGATYSFLFSGAYRYLRFNFVSKTKCLEMLKYSIPLIPNGIMWWLVGALNRPIMEANVGLYGVGLYAVANKFPSIISTLFVVFGTSWQISVLEEFGKPGYKDFFNKVFRLIFTALFLILIVLTLSSELLIDIFADEKFHEAWKYLPILAFGVILSNVSGMAGSNFSASRESKYYFYSSVWGAVVAIAMNFILIPLWGLYGAAISVVISYLAMSVSRIAYSWKYVEITCIPNLLINIILVIALIIVVITEQPIWLIYLVAIGVTGWLLISNRDLGILVMERIKSMKK